MQLISAIGLLMFLGIAWLLSNNKSRIRPRIIFWGIGLQLLFAVIILSKGTLSLAGMFVLLCMIVLYLFAEEMVASRSFSQRLKFAGILISGTFVIAGGAVYSAASGVTTVLLWVSIFAGALLAYFKKNLWQRRAVALFLSLGFGMLVARDIHGQIIMQAFSANVDAFLKLTDFGSRFIFGNLADPQHFGQFGFQFAFSVLPTIIFFAAFISILYYLGVVQVIVETLSKFMRWTMGTSGAETLSCTSNVFVGQTEAPLLIKPFLNDMTISELATVMVGGFATIAGGVLAGYIRVGVDPGHLIAASVMSAPAALVIGKIIFPEVDQSKTAGDVTIPTVQRPGNILEAASNGITDGLKLAVNVGAMLLAFIALIALVDVILNFIDTWIDGRLLGGAWYDTKPTAFSPVTGEYSGLFPGSLKTLFGSVLRYVAFMMGTPWQDSAAVGNLLGLKLTINEFVAYGTLGQYIAEGALSERAQIIATYALCGFANFASIGIQLGGIGAIAPERKKDLAAVAFKAMLGGAIASWMTATIAGMFL